MKGPSSTSASPRSRREPSLDELERGVRDGNRALLGRAITLVESNRPEHREHAQELLVRLLRSSGEAHRVGISGVPGVGKSTFIENLGTSLTDQGHRVAVLAVDPTSSVSRGSILGDKTRMPKLARNERAFIRPSPTGGSLGGVTRKTRETMIVCEAAGFDVVLVETVGVGQSETQVADMVDFFVVLMIAGGGDELQGIKRGILELAEMIAINKADGPNLDAARRAQVTCERALRLMHPDHGSWTPPVLTVSGLENRGLDELWREVERHREITEKSGELREKRRRQLIRWMWSVIDEELGERLRRHPDVRRRAPELERDVLDGRTTPTMAAIEILGAFGLDAGN